MIPERWQQVERIYQEAAGLSASRRAEFLTGACDGDLELRGEVERMLSGEAAVTGFLESGALGAAARALARERLTAGTRIGPYEIQSLLGAGGMGEVYKAQDTRLKRTVAIKVLPRYAAADEDRRKRLLREARTASALNHPHIVTIHDIVSEGGQDYLVMEYIKGDPLKGPLPLEKALEYAGQIASALDAAHTKKITHRDLKPANILVTKQGVKLLDFGLAKMEKPVAVGQETMTMPLTREGQVLGTLLYMSPEQVMGQEADARSDIFALGLVLYEMLTGKRAFQGSTPASVMGAILERPAPSISDVAPAALASVLKRCLEKDPEKRWQSARDLNAALQLVTPPTPEAIAVAKRNPMPRWAWGAGSIGVAAALVWSVSHLNSSSVGDLTKAPVVSSTLLPPQGAEFDLAGNTLALPALSPDGTHIVFGVKTSAGKHQLWFQRLASPNAQPLSGTEDGMFPFWSPDSRWVGFGQGKTLLKIDIHGGPPVAITELSQPMRGATWSRAGVIVFGVTGGPTVLSRVAAAGGSPATPATVMEQGSETSGHRYPWFLPDGRHFLYSSQQTGDIPVRVGSLDEPGKPGRIVAKAQSFVRYAQGHLLFLRENTLMAQPFDPDRLQTTGDAMPLADGVPAFTRPSRAAAFTVSTGGMLVYQSSTIGAQSRLEWKDRQGRALGSMGEPTGRIYGIRLSPDMKRVVEGHGERAGSIELWIYDSARANRTRFTSGPESYSNAVWSPNRDSLYYSTTRMGRPHLFRKSLDGAEAEELLLSDVANPTSISRDGKLLLYSRLGERTGNDLWVVPLTAAEAGAKPEPKVFLQTPFEERQGQFSPDGLWIAYASNDSGQSEVYAAPFRGPGGKRQISYGGGMLPLWRDDGKELFYVTSEGQLMAAEVALRSGTLEIGHVQKLFGGVITNGDRGMSYGISPNGQKVLVVVDEGTPSGLPLTLLQNWTASLRKPNN